MKMINVEMATKLEEAADYLFMHGHAKEKLENNSGEVCAVGALGAVVTGKAVWGNSFEQNELMKNLIYVLSDAVRDIGLKYSNIVSWNNAPERTGDEVIELFRTVAKELRNTDKTEKKRMKVNGIDFKRNAKIGSRDNRDDHRYIEFFYFKNNKVIPLAEKSTTAMATTKTGRVLLSRDGKVYSSNGRKQK